MKMKLTHPFCASILLAAASTCALARPCRIKIRFPPANANPGPDLQPGRGVSYAVDGNPRRGVAHDDHRGQQRHTRGALTPQTLSIWHQDNLTGDWGGVRDNLLNHGVAITPTWIGEVFGNPSGGTGRGVISDGLINVALDLDLDRMSDSPIFDFTQHPWPTPCTSTVRACRSHSSAISSNTSNIAFYNSVRLQELWIQKAFWQQRVQRQGRQHRGRHRVLPVGERGALHQRNLRRLHLHRSQRAQRARLSAGVARRAHPVPAHVEFLHHGRVFGQDINSDPTTNNQNGIRFKPQQQQRHADHVRGRLPREPVAE